MKRDKKIKKLEMKIQDCKTVAYLADAKIRSIRGGIFPLTDKDNSLQPTPLIFKSKKRIDEFIGKFINKTLQS